MRSIAPIRTAKIGYIVLSVLLCVLGILLIAAPGLSLRLIGILCGILLIVFGAVRLTGYFSQDLFRLAFQYDLAFGLLLIVLGVIVLARPGNVMLFLCIALGVAILSDALFKVQVAMDSRSFGIRLWWLILLLAIVTGIIGLLLIFRPYEGSTALTILFGVSLLSEGLLNLTTVLTAVKIVRHQQPDYPEDHLRKD